MAELSIIVPGPEIVDRVRAALGDRDAEIVPVAAGFAALKAALGGAGAPIAVVLADAQDPPELVPLLVDKLAASPDVDAVLAARPRGAWRARLANAVATRAPIRGANGTCAMRRPLAERVSRVRLARADLPALLARLGSRTTVLQDARVGQPTARPSLSLSGALVQWLVLAAVLLYALAGVSFAVLPSGAARVVNDVMLVFCAVALIAGLVVHVRVLGALRERTGSGD